MNKISDRLKWNIYITDIEMDATTDTTSRHDDSDFQSCDEDAEFQLYAQLYFEVNHDIPSLKSETNDTDKKTGDEEAAPVTTQKENSSCAVIEKDHVKSKLDVEKKTCAPDTQGTSSASTLQDYLSLTSIHNQNTAVCQNSMNSDGMSHKRLASARVRLSSTCSDRSIPGSLPLDTLYCNVNLDDDIIEENMEDESESLNSKSVELHRIPATCNRTKSRKRKRDITEEDEDSRCATLLNLSGRQRPEKHIMPRKKPKLESDTDSDDLSAACNSSEVMVVSAESLQKMEMGQEKGKEKPQELKEKNQKKNDTLDTDSCLKQTNSGRTLVHDADVIILEDDNDIQVVGGRTKLVCNISKSLSGYLNGMYKPMSMTSSPAKKKRKVKERHTLDYTLGRPNTMKKPSCDKWTQEMANFYDSDVSEEFDVNEIHDQQSGE